MGVLQRFERRLEGMVEGAFARAFGGVVQPVEVAAALQREAADKKAIVAHGRVLVPNTYVVELAAADNERLAEYDEALRKELADMVSEHAKEQGWSFVGPVTVALEQVDDLTTGTFRVRSAVVAGKVAGAPAGTAGRSDPASSHGRPQLQLASGTEAGRVLVLADPVTVIGRGADAHLRLTDIKVSRLHAEIRVDDERTWLVDLGSSNGTTLNGRPIDTAALNDGDRIRVGDTEILFREAG